MQIPPLPPSYPPSLSLFLFLSCSLSVYVSLLYHPLFFFYFNFLRLLHLCLPLSIGSVIAGCTQGDWLLSYGEAANHRGGGKHEWLCLS